MSEFSREAGGEEATAIRKTTAATHITNRQGWGWDRPAILLYKVVNEVSLWFIGEEFSVCV